MAAAVSQTVVAEAIAGRRHATADLGQLATTLARWLGVGMLLLAAVIVVSRRLAGGLSGPPSPIALIAVTVAGAGLVHLVDRAGRGSRLAGCGLVGWLARGCLLVTLAAVGLFWSHVPMAAFTAVIMLSTGIGLAAPAGWRPRLPGWGFSLPPLPRWPATTRRVTPLEPTATPASSTGPPRPHALAGHLVQWQERYLLADGRERLRGRLVVTLAAESRLATGHIGFCPPFSAIPDATVTTDYDALEVVVDAAEVLPWGIRVECRVEDPADEPVAIPIDVDVSLPAAPPLSDLPPQTD